MSLAETERLSALLRRAGADVTVALQPVGHELTTQDITQAREWLSAVFPQAHHVER